LADAGGVSDDTLMTLAVAGDVAAFSALMRRHQQSIIRYLGRALADPEDARDVCQDVFIEAWQRRQSYEPRGLLVAWLFRIARSRAISRGRFHAVRRLFAARQRDELDATGGPRPDDIHDQRQQAARLRRALLTLPPALREAVALRHGAELDHATIADVLGVDVATARQRACRGLALLRTRLGPEEPP
jgi:RNA polymerase sigma factor (sigma-70 family)